MKLRKSIKLESSPKHHQSFDSQFNSPVAKSTPNYVNFR